ncbi:MAG: CBS domain-containing protein [Desulfurococcales archaeon]|nr:CBS domain-containing protein [Desulfurococcales archaeon]
MSLDLMTLEELGRKDFPTISKNDSVENLLKILEKAGMDRAIVLADGKPEGIVTKKDIISRIASTRSKVFPTSVLHVSSVMTYPLISLPPTTPVVKAARVMVDEGISSIPAIEGDEVKALLTKWEITKELKGSETPLREVMSAGVRKLLETDSLIKARKVMLEEGYSMLPVIRSDGEPIGVLTVSELLDTLVEFIDLLSESGAKDTLSRITVGEIMRPYIPTLQEDSQIKEAVALMLDKEIRGVLIEGHNQELVGIVTITDLTKLVAAGGAHAP